MNIKHILFLTLFYVYSIFAVENSIVPKVEQVENIQNLPVQKYSKSQFSEISDALSHLNERVRIASFNILFKGADQKLTPENHWANRLPRIVEVIREMQPDLIGIQELYGEMHDELMSYLEKDYTFYGEACADGELNGILYRNDRFEVLARKVLYFPETPDAPSSDIQGVLPISETLTLLHLKDLKTGQTFAMFNTHLAFSSADKRESQVRFITESIQPYVKKMPVVLTGDLNTFPNRFDLEKLPFYDGDYLHRLLMKGSLSDAKEVSLLGHLGPISTFTNAPNDKQPFQGEGTPGVILDHVYVNEMVTILIHAVQSGRVDGCFPSDHMPIFVDCFM